MRFRQAMEQALYGPDGFFRRTGPGPAGHFRTSVHASPLFAAALAVLVARLDAALGEPDPFDLVDVGGGRGELLTGLLAALPPDLAKRVRATGVELAARPAGLPSEIGWTADLPTAVTGLLVATEWLDNVPLEIVEVDPDGVVRYLDERLELAEPIEPADAAWLERWWPLDPAATGARAEIGAPRDAAWQAAVGAVERGLALAVDYGHVAGHRPLFGSLAAFRHGREVEPVTDGTSDLTCAVAMDSLAPASTGWAFAAAGGAHRARGRRRPPTDRVGHGRSRGLSAGARAGRGGGRAHRPGRAGRTLVVAAMGMNNRHTGGTLPVMTAKVTLSFSDQTIADARLWAERDGVSLSAWIDRAAQERALREIFNAHAATVRKMGLDDDTPRWPTRKRSR